MKRVGSPPKSGDKSTAGWFKDVTDRLNIYRGTSDPLASEVPQGQWIVFHNTTLNETRVWANFGGTLVKSAAFT
jgi:hypothetical protein